MAVLMMFFLKSLRFHCLAVIFLTATILFAQEPAGYYRAAEGKSAAALKTALFNIIKVHKQLEYYSSSTAFKTTDWHPPTDSRPNGYFWDMYSNNIRTTWSGMNREHNLPKSWFGIASGSENTAAIATDLHNLYPSDAEANSAKSNYPLGVVGGTPSYSNGVVKVGNNIFPGYSGVVFEPANEYKGDFARCYMYMVTCYEDYKNAWQSLGASSMLIVGSSYPVFRPYAVNLLLKWCADDPVSEKEIKRNNAVYALQQNRNPFIDHPELIDFLWGARQNENWSINIGPTETEELKVFPNPATVEIKVELLQPVQSYYTIENVMGELFRTGKFDASSTINTSTLPAGVYLIKVYAGGKRKVAKFIIAKP